MDNEKQDVSGSVPAFGAIMTMSALALGNISAVTPMQASANESAQSSITAPVYLLEQYASALGSKPEIVTSGCKAEADVELETIFNGLAKTWRDETGGYSLTMRRYAHTSYQSILALEPKKDVISLILLELKQRPDRWFEALKALTKANPAQDAKTFNETVQRWIEWGKSEKYIS